MENINLFYQDIGPSSSAGSHLTLEEAEKETLAVKINQKFALLKEERPVIKTMVYNDKYKKILDEIWRDKVELDRKTVKEEEDAVKRIKGEAFKEKDDPGAFIFLIRLEGKVNKNALADTGWDIITIPYRIYETLKREEIKKIDRGIPMINHTQVEAMGKLSNVLCQVGTLGRHDGEAGRRDPNAQDNTKQWKSFCFHKFTTSSCYGKDVDERLSLDDMLRIRVRKAGSNEKIFTYVAWLRAFSINEPIYTELCHKLYSTYEFNERIIGYDKIQKNDLWLLSMFDARHQNGYTNVAWLARKYRVLTEDVVRSLSALIYCRDLDTTTLRELIDSGGKLIQEDPQPGVPRVGIPRPSRASMQD
nr:hypothetical protein [Tanacetum cinerariifolium]